MHSLVPKSIQSSEKHSILFFLGGAFWNAIRVLCELFSQKTRISITWSGCSTRTAVSSTSQRPTPPIGHCLRSLRRRAASNGSPSTSAALLVVPWRWMGEIWVVFNGELSQLLGRKWTRLPRCRNFGRKALKYVKSIPLRRRSWTYGRHAYLRSGHLQRMPYAPNPQHQRTPPGGGANHHPAPHRPAPMLLMLLNKSSPQRIISTPAPCAWNWNVTWLWNQKLFQNANDFCGVRRRILWDVERIDPRQAWLKFGVVDAWELCSTFSWGNEFAADETSVFFCVDDGGTCESTKKQSKSASLRKRTTTWTLGCRLS